MLIFIVFIIILVFAAAIWAVLAIAATEDLWIRTVCFLFAIISAVAALYFVIEAMQYATLS